MMATPFFKKQNFTPKYALSPIFNKNYSAHDKKIKKSDKTRHNSNFFDELNHAKSYQT